MKSKKRLTYASLIGVAGVFSLMVQAANTTVPGQWNVNPWTNGLNLQQFSDLPPWASTEILADGTARPAGRFWSSTSPEKVLSFATPGITNTFSGAKIQPGMPLFIDMRCKLTPFDTTPSAMEANTLLCFYANEKSNLVVASGIECKTNESITIYPTTYYPIMIRFAVDKFDVFFNNDSTPALFLKATTNEISKMVISGAGEMDDLYVSYGDPRRSEAYYPAPVPFDSSPDATQTVINNWVASQTTTNVALRNQTISGPNAEKYYLTDTALSTADFTGQLGIGSFSYDPNTSNVTVVVTLKTDSSTKKTGKINGKLQLKGAGDYNAAKSGGWSSVLATTTILTNDFVNGVATYKFTLTGDANTNKFFLPIIVSDIK
jgi:hypothetical protein